MKPGFAPLGGNSTVNEYLTPSEPEVQSSEPPAALSVFKEKRT